MKTMRISKRLVEVMILLTILFSCDGETEPTAEENAQSARNAAVTAYLNSNYQTALNKFIEAFNYGATTVQAECAAGVGFSLVRLQRFSDADSAYNAAITNFPNNTDALAMGVLLAYAYDEYGDCIARANALLALDSSYSLSFYPELNNQDIILHKALSQFKLSDYNGSYNSLLTIDATPGFTINDPDLVNKLANRLMVMVGNLSD
ncbi:MAG: hypothetical protein KDD94_00795 [Calditrichaeota bacterium]|nr:hypothetical protein [Calditrichota bacterium]